MRNFLDYISRAEELVTAQTLMHVTAHQNRDRTWLRMEMILRSNCISATTGNSPETSDSNGPTVRINNTTLSPRQPLLQGPQQSDDQKENNSRLSCSNRDCSSD